MAGRVPEGWVKNNNHEYDASQISSSLKSHPIDNNVSSIAVSQAQESNGNSSNTLPCNGTAVAKEEMEWVEQVESGVFITVSPFPGGGKHLKRVRFRYGRSLSFFAEST